MYGDHVPVTAEEANKEAREPYEVVFVHSTSATTCYGCKGRVRDKPSAPIHPCHTIYLFRIKDVEFTTFLGKRPFQLVQSPRWYVIIHFAHEAASTRMMWKREDQPRTQALSLCSSLVVTDRDPGHVISVTNQNLREGCSSTKLCRLYKKYSPGVG